MVKRRGVETTQYLCGRRVARGQKLCLVCLCDQQDRVLYLGPSPTGTAGGAGLRQRSSLGELGRQTYWNGISGGVAQSPLGAFSRPLSLVGRLSWAHRRDSVLPSKDRNYASDLGLYSNFCRSCFYGAGIELGFTHTR